MRIPKRGIRTTLSLKIHIRGGHECKTRHMTDLVVIIFTTL